VLGAGPADDFTPLQSGEYAVTYTKTTATGTAQCSYPLFVGAPGLRVELEWEFEFRPLGGTGPVDLDLHLHKPGDTTPWGGAGGNDVVCAWDNCTAFNYDPASATGPEWFGASSWHLDPVFEKNTCYFGPKGNGSQWQAIGMGCHTPRLDIDNVQCDPTRLDPLHDEFCNAENVNLDFVPPDQWTRIGVHYYGNHDQTYDVHPRVKVYCDGVLAADLGPAGFGMPTAPVTFPADFHDTGYWLVADVMLPSAEAACTMPRCVVQPIYQDSAARSPWLTTTVTVSSEFQPPYPDTP